MPESKAHVICQNDSVEFVYNGDIEDAEKKMLTLSYQSFLKQEQQWISEWKRDYPCELDPKQHPMTAFDYYSNRIYWHIHTVDCVNSKDELLNKRLTDALSLLGECVRAGEVEFDLDFIREIDGFINQVEQDMKL